MGIISNRMKDWGMRVRKVMVWDSHEQEALPKEDAWSLLRLAIEKVMEVELMAVRCLGNP